MSNALGLDAVARPVRRTVAKAKRAEVNLGDKQKLSNEELNYVGAHVIYIYIYIYNNNNNNVKCTIAPTEFKGTPEEHKRIEEAVRANFLFQHLNAKQRESVFNSMYKVLVKKDDQVIQQGDAGDKFYIIDSGQYDVIVTPKNANNEMSAPVVVHTYNVKGDNFASFGELALLYDKPRAATVRAKTDGMYFVAYKDYVLT